MTVENDCRKRLETTVENKVLMVRGSEITVEKDRGEKTVEEDRRKGLWPGHVYGIDGQGVRK